MTDQKIPAIKCASEITAEVTNLSDRAFSVTGNDVADFFEAVYKKIYEIASTRDN